MLPGRHRLRRSADVQRVRQEGRRQQHPLLVLLVLDHAREVPSATRIAIAAGRRVGKAVERNRVKRRLREIIRRYLEHVGPDFDILFIAKTAAASANHDELERAVQQLLKSAGVWVEDKRRADDEGRGLSHGDENTGSGPLK